MNEHPNQHALDSLNAERYGPSTWFTTRQGPPPALDDEVTTARRRRELARAFDETKEASG